MIVRFTLALRQSGCIFGHPPRQMHGRPANQTQEGRMLGTGFSVTTLASTVLAAAMLTACGGGGNDGAQDTATGADTVAETTADQASALPDSIPMDVSVTFSGGTATKGGGAGTYTASGNGATCSHDPTAQAGKTMAEWTVTWANEQSPVALIRMQIGKTGPDNTAREMMAMVTAGQIEGLGMKVPQMFMIGTFPSGAVSGRGIARVQRQGEGARIEVDAEMDPGGTKMKAVILCKKLGAV
jgi:hypothetical protein